MARRVFGGIVGGVLGVLPLLVVNVGAALAQVVFTGAEPVLVGAGALLGGLLLGGIVAGVAGAGGREESGASGTLIAGGLAAGVYVALVLATLYVAGQVGAEPDVILAHPLRAGAALLFLAALLMVIALLAGALAARRTATVTDGARPPQPPRFDAQGGQPTHATSNAPRDGRARATQPVGARRAPPSAPAATRGDAPGGRRGQREERAPWEGQGPQR